MQLNKDADVVFFMFLLFLAAAKITEWHTSFCAEIVVRKDYNIYGSCLFTWTYNVVTGSFS